MQYVEVLVDAPTRRQSLYYSLPPALLPDITIGSFVRVPFREKVVDGLVVTLRKRLPKGLAERQLRYVNKVVAKNIVPPFLFELARWMSDYYLCRENEALFAMLPPLPKTEKHEIDFFKAVPSARSRRYFIYGREDSRWAKYLTSIENAIRRGGKVLIVFPSSDKARQFVEKSSGTINKLVQTCDVPYGRRFRLWEEIAGGQYDCVVGTRSLIFSPLKAVLVIIDDETHPGYKNERHPRYHVRDIALARSRLEGSTLILGGMTPSLASFALIQKKQLRRIDLAEKEPFTVIVDVQNKRDVISVTVEQALSKFKRAIIVVTRLGAGAATLCVDCRYLFRCPNCSLPLTLHEGPVLRCHHCGKKKSLPLTCPRCGSTHLKAFGMGTENIESYLKARWPSLRIERLEAGRPISKVWDILVATIKILDTDFTAPLVAISSLDTLLELPDPFAHEHLASLLIQLRARADKQFLIQTHFPEHRVFKVLRDETHFLSEELAIRKKFNYPPVNNLVRVLHKGKSPEVVERRLVKLVSTLKEKLPPQVATVLGPGPAFYEKLKGQFRWHFIIKLLKDDRAIRRRLRSWIPDDMRIDVNPIDLL